MERLIEMFLGGGLRIPFFDAETLALDRELPKSDIFALLILQRRGQATMSELAADMNAPLSTATGIGARLARKGLASRERDSLDRRVIVLQLTPEGAELAVRVRSYLDGLIGRITSVLTPDELQQLMGLVQKLFMGLKVQPDGAPSEANTESTGPRRIALDDD